jgi:hypothetical protein
MHLALGFLGLGRRRLLRLNLVHLVHHVHHVHFVHLRNLDGLLRSWRRLRRRFRSRLLWSGSGSGRFRSRFNRFSLFSGLRLEGALVALPTGTPAGVPMPKPGKPMVRFTLREVAEPAMFA